ncbi:MAG: zf-TFIIB domain-containing protein [Methanomicrobiales archaeon]|nr:zf-TFIIB domain-containing protein [Methanomicrobiales archaeon]
MKYPACDVDLHMSERLIVQIDYCPTCRDIGIANDKIDKLLECSVTNSDPKGRNQPGKDGEESGFGGFPGGIFD